MNTAEMKLEMYRKIDNLSETEFHMIYEKFMDLLNFPGLYKTSGKEQKAINEALSMNEPSSQYLSDEVRSEAQQKYPNLKFK